MRRKYIHGLIYTSLSFPFKRMPAITRGEKKQILTSYQRNSSGKVLKQNRVKKTKTKTKGAGEYMWILRQICYFLVQSQAVLVLIPKYVCASPSLP